MLPGDVESLTTSFWSLGAEVRASGSAWCTSRASASSGGPTNFLHHLRPRTPSRLHADLDDLAATARRVVLDHDTPAWATAELVAADWHLHPQLHLVLPADAHPYLGEPPHLGEPPEAAPRALRDLAERDWPAVSDMLVVDHDEEDERAGRVPRPASHTLDAVLVRRQIAEHAHYLVAVDRTDRGTGFVCTWTRPDTTHAIIEDLFVQSQSRRHGLATALLAAAVDRARSGGAGDIAIAADPTDTPKALYRHLGFHPLTLTYSLSTT